MESLIYQLQLAGIVKVIPQEEAALTKFDAIFPGNDKLNDSKERFQHVANLLKEYKEKTPTLLDQGRSLCKNCTNVDRETAFSESGYVHSECYWELLASAEVSQCPLCVLLVKALRNSIANFDVEVKLLNPLRTDHQICLKAKDSAIPKKRGELHVTISNGAPVIGEGRLSILSSKGQSDSSASWPMSSDAKFALLQRELSKQDQEYGKVAPDLPARVVDVGFSSQLDEDVRLVQTSGLSPRNVPYITLSYRWGDTNSMKTTKSTINDRMRGIRFSELPCTVRDAVTVARRLGVRYLWVDALSIIQDDEVDWQREAEKMGEIYMHSYCTIAAHAAKHADHGFLEQALASPKMVETGGLCIVQGSSRRLHIEESELSTRGWVLQERLLSPRILHFAEDGAIYFESSSGPYLLEDESDIGDRNRPRALGVRSMVQQLAHANRGISESEPSVNVDRVYYDWYQIVERYSKCSLTKLEDKLPALTGVIRLMENFTKDTCHMGVWEQKLPQCLLWLRGKAPLSAQTKYRAPSWSWAAYKGEVQHPNWSSSQHDKTLRPEYLQASFAHSPGSEGSEAGTLTGRAGLFIKGAKMLRNIAVPTGRAGSGTGLRFMKGRTGKPAWVQAVNREPLKYETRFWTVHDDYGKQIGWASLDLDESVEVDGEERHFTCIAIASYSDDDRARGLMRGYLVLLIKRIQPSMWMRVGMGQIEDTAWFESVKPVDMLLI